MNDSDFVFEFFVNAYPADRREPMLVAAGAVSVTSTDHLTHAETDLPAIEW
jgi:hypothetical protein